ncbi:MAG TPA: cysteine desulfurase family protein [Candidatus Cloacimonadota bacterium]|nr:cysteine desulfurase family protein [Candidatus Cloacimonadota bacterium]
MSQRIYMDNCVTSPLAPEVFEAMKPYFSEQFWFPGTFVSTGEATNSAIEGFRKTVADALNAQSSEITFTSGGTLANNIALKGLTLANSDKGRHIIVSVVDYPDLLTNAAYFESMGFELSYLEPDAEGMVSADKLKAALRPDTILFMSTMVNHVVGTIQPIAEYSQVLAAADHKIWFHVDAGQAFGKLPLDVKALNVDTLSVSAHKLHGPQGIGALYVKKGTKLSPYIHGVKRFDSLQPGGLSLAAIAGFARAVELVFQDLDGNIRKLRELSDYLLERLKGQIDHIELNGPRGAGRACHNINVSIDYIEGEAITMMLDMHGITVATGSACASQGLKPNYVLMAMGKNHVQSHGSMKFTLSRYNTREQIDFTVARLKEISATLRERSPLYTAIKDQER